MANHEVITTKEAYLAHRGFPAGWTADKEGGDPADVIADIMSVDAVTKALMYKYQNITPEFKSIPQIRVGDIRINSVPTDRLGRYLNHAIRVKGTMGVRIVDRVRDPLYMITLLHPPINPDGLVVSIDIASGFALKPKPNQTNIIIQALTDAWVVSQFIPNPAKMDVGFFLGYVRAVVYDPETPRQMSVADYFVQFGGPESLNL